MARRGPGDDPDDSRRLREAFASLSERARPREDCPEPDRLWAALKGELPARARRKVVEHMSTCPACAEGWRLARELGGDPAVEAVRAGRESWLRPFPRLRWPWSYAPLVGVAAALFVAVVIAPRFLGPRPAVVSSPELRAPATTTSPRPSEQPAIGQRPELVFDQRRRDPALLEWEPAAAGSLYHVTMTTEDLVPFLSARDLTVPRLSIPAAKFATLPAGTKLLWQVETKLPDGTRVRSETFVLRIQ